MNNKNCIIVYFTVLIMSCSFISVAQPDAKQPLHKAAFNEDLYVIGDECVGGDCVDGEILANTTIRLKENNLRIEFDDTSGQPNFPSTDWRISANDSFLGGDNYFRIEDRSAVTTPFNIEGGAPTNALWIDPNGRVGLGSNNPTKTLHVVGDGLITGELDVLSDLRLKKEMREISEATKIIRKLHPISYYMRTDHYPHLKLATDLQYGLIAQEVKDVLPELVSSPQVTTPEEEAFMSVNYIQIIPILIKANQEQSKEIESLRSSLKVLADRIAAIENQKKDE